jgi:polycomb group RING finger protein 3
MLLNADEIKREREFYRSRGLPYPKDILPNTGEVEEEKAGADAHAESDYHRTDEQVFLYKLKEI